MIKNIILHEILDPCMINFVDKVDINGMEWT